MNLDNFSLISEKIVNNLIYTAYRNNDDPTDVIVTCSDGSTPVFDDFQTYWANLK